jgi:hypothetical protein
MNEINIPPKGSFAYRNGIASKLKRLNIGEYLVFSHDRAKNAYSCANRIGIEICTRRISEDKTRVYRVK